MHTLFHEGTLSPTIGIPGQVHDLETFVVDAQPVAGIAAALFAATAAGGGGAGVE